MVDDNLTKARHPEAPPGFTRIPKTKHNGYRKRKGDHWVRWYPDQHKGEAHLDWEPDLSAGTGVGAIKAGQFVSQRGLPGSLYAWTPDAGKASPGKTWVTPIDPVSGQAHGEPKLVEASQLQPMRSFDPESRRKRRKKKKKETRNFTPKTSSQPPRPRSLPPAPRRRPSTKGEKALAAESRKLKSRIAEAEEALKTAKAPSKIAALRVAIRDAHDQLATLGESRAAAPSANTVKWDKSNAKEGTMLHRIENGYYPLGTFQRNSDPEGRQRITHGMVLPPKDVAPLFEEFKGNLLAAASRVSSKFGISTKPGKEDVISGAKLGLMLAIRTYKGGGSFLWHIDQMMNTYAQNAARQVISGGAASIPAAQLAMVHGLIAATARATAKAGGPEPTTEQIAREWDLRKGQTFSGAKPKSLGVYTTERGKAVDQSKQQVPLDRWQVLSPTGEPSNELSYPGKRQLIEELTPFLAGDRVKDSAWINENQRALIPLRADPTLPLGAQNHLRAQIDEVLDELSPRDSEVVKVLFGLDSDESGVGHGAEFSLSRSALSDRFELARPDASRPTKTKKANAAIKAALDAFKREASSQGKGRMATEASTRWNRVGTESASTQTAPTYRELADKYGGDNRVDIYQTAVRAGHGSAVAKKLLDWKAGNLPVGQRDELLREHQKRRDAERIAMFHRQKTLPAPEGFMRPESARSQSAEHVYTSDVMNGALQALANGSKLPRKQGAPTDAKPWDDAKFQTYLARAEENLARLKATRGDNE